MSSALQPHPAHLTSLDAPDWLRPIYLYKRACRSVAFCEAKCEGRFRLLRVRSPLLTQSLTISFPHLTEMFQFRWSPAFCYLGLSATFTKRYPLRDGLPHSETAGLRDYNSSPTTIVVIYVLPRHEYPRHPLSTCSVAENKGGKVTCRPLFFLQQN